MDQSINRLLFFTGGYIGMLHIMQMERNEIK